MKIETLIGSIGGDLKDELVEGLLRRSRRKIDSALKRIRRPEAAVGVVKSPLGDLLVATSARGVALAHYLHDDSDLTVAIGKLRADFDPVEVNGRSRSRQRGPPVPRRRPGGATPEHRPDPSRTCFQKKVLDKLQAVPRGAVISYQALAASAGAPNGARAVGNALHTNPVPIYVPCHRVISSDGRIGGYGGGVARKIQLLRSEGFALDNAQERKFPTTSFGVTGTKIYCRTSCRTTAHVNRRRILFFADPERPASRACARAKSAGPLRERH